MNNLTPIANKLYTEVLHMRRNGNLKVGVPEGASKDLEERVDSYFTQQTKKHIEWEDLKREVYWV